MENRKPMRLEYLFPEINDQRKYESLYNFRLRPRVITGPIDVIMREHIKAYELGLTDKELFAAFKTRQKIDEEKFLKYWLDSFQETDEIFKLSPNIIWSDNLLDHVAHYIKEHPNSLPYFLQYNAIGIIGLLLGNSSFIVKRIIF